MPRRQSPWVVRESKESIDINSRFKIDADEELKDYSRCKITRIKVKWRCGVTKKIAEGMAIKMHGVWFGPKESIVNKGKI